VPSDASAIAELLAALSERPERISLEAGPLSEWPVRGLADAGFEAILMETRQVRAALSSMTVKTDRNDARGMAHLLCMGWFRPVHVKSMDAREQRVLLSARTALVRRLRDIENSVRGLLRGFGFRFPRMLRVRWAQSVREALAGNPTLLAIIDPLLAAGAALRDQLAILEKRVRDAARQDPVCHRLMTMPGVGAVVALTFRAAVDRPERFSSPKTIGPCFGLTPRRYQSGQTDRTGTISRAGDASVRVALFEAAHVVEAQGLGRRDRQTPRRQTGQGRARPQNRRHSPSHVDRRRRLPLHRQERGRQSNRRCYLTGLPGKDWDRPGTGPRECRWTPGKKIRLGDRHPLPALTASGWAPTCAPRTEA
jgi:transposase